MITALVVGLLAVSSPQIQEIRDLRELFVWHTMARLIASSGFACERVVDMQPAGVGALIVVDCIERRGERATVRYLFDGELGLVSRSDTMLPPDET